MMSMPHWSVVILPATSGPVSAEYAELKEKLRLLPTYEPLFVLLMICTDDEAG